MGTVKMLFGISVIAAGIYISVMLVPPYFSNYQFRDFVKEEALHDSYSHKTEDQIRTDVFKKAQEYDIPISPEQIQVQRSGPQLNATVIIRVPYTVHVEFPGYPVDLNFDASTENKGVF